MKKIQVICRIYENHRTRGTASTVASDWTEYLEPVLFAVKLPETGCKLVPVQTSWRNELLAGSAVSCPDCWTAFRTSGPPDEIITTWWRFESGGSALNPIMVLWLGVLCPQVSAALNRLITGCSWDVVKVRTGSCKVTAEVYPDWPLTVRSCRWKCLREGICGFALPTVFPAMITVGYHRRTSWALTSRRTTLLMLNNRSTYLSVSPDIFVLPL